MFKINLAVLEDLTEGSKAEMDDLLLAYNEVSAEFITAASQTGSTSMIPLANAAHKFRSIVHLVGLQSQVADLAELERMARPGHETDEITTLKQQILALAIAAQEQIDAHLAA